MAIALESAGDILSEAPKAIILDLDNTIYYYPSAHDAAISATQDKVFKTFNIPRESFLKCFEEARRQVKERLGLTASSHSRLLYLQSTLESLGLKAQPLLALDLEQIYWRTFLAHAPLLEGVREFLMLLKSRDVSVAVVTDLTAQIQLRKIIFFGIEPYVDHIVTSEEAGGDKETLVPFEIAKRKLSLDKGAKIWSIGDGVHDVVTIKKAMDCVSFQIVHSPAEAVHSEADVNFSSFLTFSKILENNWRE